jgi:hypothetical protein
VPQALSRAPHPTFGGTGQVVTDLSGQLSKADGVAVQPDGKIVAAGTTGPSQPGPASDVAVVRNNADDPEVTLSYRRPGQPRTP